MFVETKKEGEQQASHFIPSFGDLIAWLETQRPDQEYDWKRVKGCLMCAYYEARQVRCVTGWDRNDGPIFNYTDAFPGDICEQVKAYHGICRPEPWTFGAALERARAITPTYR